ncbi:MAG: class I SAM-dependent methyltransferase [Bacteroidales bacterium]
METKKVNLRYGDFLTVESENEKYDKIFCLNVIYFWNDLNKAFKKINSLLTTKGEYWIYMEHERELEKYKFAKDFCKYSIENVETDLKNAGFVSIDYIMDKGYYIKAKK